MSYMKQRAMAEAEHVVAQGHRYESFDQYEAAHWQQWQGDDPGYWAWLRKIETDRNDDSGRRADAMIAAGTNPF